MKTFHRLITDLMREMINSVLIDREKLNLNNNCIIIYCFVPAINASNIAILLEMNFNKFNDSLIV